MPRKPRQPKNNLHAVENKIEKIERAIVKSDARHEWAKSNNMRQYCVTLRDTVYLE
jgi:hypothetical protein